MTRHQRGWLTLVVLVICSHMALAADIFKPNVLILLIDDLGRSDVHVAW